MKPSNKISMQKAIGDAAVALHAMRQNQVAHNAEVNFQVLDSETRFRMFHKNAMAIQALERAIEKFTRVTCDECGMDADEIVIPQNHDTKENQFIIRIERNAAG